MDEKVSVVIPYSPRHTSVDMLKEAIESVRHQKVGTDIIVISSRDLNHISAEITEIRDKEQKGPAWARNQGIEYAKNRYVAFLDADDVWKPNKLKKQIIEMDSQDAGLCLEGQDKSQEQFLDAVVKGEMVSVTSSIVIDSHKVSTKFNEDLIRYEDHFFLINSAVEAGVCLCPDLIYTRKHDSGLSASTSKQVIDDVINTLGQMKNTCKKRDVVERFIKWRLYMCGVHYRKMGYYNRAAKAQIRSIEIGLMKPNVLALLTLPGFWIINSVLHERGSGPD